MPADRVLVFQQQPIQAHGFLGFGIIGFRHCVLLWVLQHSRGAASRLHYFIFDLLVYQQRDLTRLPLLERREIMSPELGFRSPRIQIADYFETSARAMVSAVREQGLGGVAAKRKDSVYEAGKRSGSWVEYRLNRGQELVIRGYVPDHAGSIRLSSDTTKGAI